MRRFLIVSFEKALAMLSRDDRFKPAIYAMNTLSEIKQDPKV
jgi:hypothetical protein